MALINNGNTAMCVLKDSLGTHSTLWAQIGIRQYMQLRIFWITIRFDFV